MRRSLRWPMWSLAAVVLSSGVASAEVRAAPAVTIGADEVVKEDLYAAASTVRVEGIIEGDLVTTAGTVEIPGQITGDLLALGGNIRVSGKVGGSVRVAGGELELRGPVTEDVLAGVGTLRIDSASAIGRDVMATAGEARVLGPIQGNLRLTGGNITLGAPIGGKANLTAQSLSLEDGAKVTTLTYRGQQPAKVAAGAEVGTLEKLELPERSPVAMVTGFIVAWFRAFFAFTVLGVLLALVSPHFARAVPEVLRERPWQSLGWGALVLFLAPFVAFAFFFAGVLLGGWWLGLIASGIVLTAVALSVPVVGFQLGQRVVAMAAATNARRLGALVLGVAVITLVLRVPFLGVLVALAIAAFGLGSMLQAGLRLRRTPPIAG